MSGKYNVSPQEIFQKLLTEDKMKIYLKGLYSIAAYADRLLKLNKLLGNNLHPISQ